MTPVFVDFLGMTAAIKADISKLREAGMITKLDVRGGQLVMTPSSQQAILHIGVMVGKHKELNYLYDYIL